MIDSVSDWENLEIWLIFLKLKYFSINLNIIK